MEPKPFEKPASSSPIPVYIAPAMDSSDEISLVDLWRVIQRRKVIILVSLLLSVLLALTYLVVVTPVYKANAYLLPPQQDKIQRLLIGHQIRQEDVDTNQYTPKNVFDAFLDTLKSRGVRREFFENNGLIKHYASNDSANNSNVEDAFYELFNERLKVEIDKQNLSFVTISFRDSDPKMAAQWLNQFIDFANKRTVLQLLSDVNAAIQSEMGEVRHQLDSKLKVAEQRRLDRIITLREALHVAKSLDIRDASSFSQTAERTSSGLAINTAEVPLYMRGIEALSSEISVLQARKSDEPFAEGYRVLQEKLAFLEGISISADALSAVTIDMAANIPFRAEKPRKGRIIILAVFLGIMVGLFLAFATEFFYKLRQQSGKEMVIESLP